MSPLKLRNIFLLLSIIGTLIILSLSSIFISNTLESYNVSFAQRNSVNIGHTLLQREKEVLIDSLSGKLITQLDEASLQSFDKRLRKLLSPMHMVKIKIFLPDGHIIYSTDHSVINSKDSNNEYLQRALAGTVSSKLLKKDSILDLSHENRFKVDVIETYLPIQDFDGDILGVYEIYLDISEYQQDASVLLKKQLFFLGFLLVLILSLGNLLMWRNSTKMMKLQNKLSYKAHHDELTRCYNRAYLNERLPEELSRVKRSKIEDQYQSSVLIIDIDFFKQFNDQYGHLVGDGVLYEFAHRLKSLMRLEDKVFRYGGEEFLVLLPMTSPDKALQVANKIQKAIVAKPYTVSNNEYQITASIGVSHIINNDKTIQDVINRADKALYHVKANGRNDVAEYDIYNMTMV